MLSLSKQEQGTVQDSCFDRLSMSGRGQARENGRGLTPFVRASTGSAGAAILRPGAGPIGCGAFP